MADPSPTDPPEGQEPEDGEGQEPDGETGSDPQEGKEPKTYPEAYVRQLRRESAANRNRLAEVEERLKEFEDRDKSDHEKLTARAEAAERKAADAETRLLRYEVADELGLDAKAAAFLTGSTREELEHRGEELKKLLAENAAPPGVAGLFDGGARPPAPEKKGTPEKEHNDFLLRQLGRQPSR